MRDDDAILLLRGKKVESPRRPKKEREVKKGHEKESANFSVARSEGSTTDRPTGRMFVVFAEVGAGAVPSSVSFWRLVQLLSSRWGIGR
jgi:hypothetical protein